MDCDSDNPPNFLFSTSDNITYTLSSEGNPFTVTDEVGTTFDTFTIGDFQGSHILYNDQAENSCVTFSSGAFAVADCTDVTSDQLFNFYIPRSLINEVEIKYDFKSIIETYIFLTEEVDRRIFYNPDPKDTVTLDKEIEDISVTETYKFTL